MNALSEWMEVRIWRHGIEHLIRFRNGDAEAPLAVVGPGDQRKRHRGDLQAEPGHLHPHRVRLRPAGAAAARAGVPEFRPRPSCCATNATRRRSRACCATTAAWSPSSSGWTAARPRCSRRRSACAPRTRRWASGSSSRCRGTTASTRRCCASPTTSRSATAARIWPASARR